MAARSGPAELAYVLSRGALYRIHSHRRAGLVLCHAGAISAGCAGHTDESFAANDHTLAHAAASPDAPAHAHTAPNTQSNTYAYSYNHPHSNRNIAAVLHATDYRAMKKTSMRALLRA